MTIITSEAYAWGNENFLDATATRMKRTYNDTLGDLTGDKITLTDVAINGASKIYNSTGTLAIAGFRGTVDVQYNRLNLDEVWQFKHGVIPVTEAGDVTAQQAIDAYFKSTSLPVIGEGLLADPTEVITVTEGKVTVNLNPAHPECFTPTGTLTFHATIETVLNLATLPDNVLAWRSGPGDNIKSYNPAMVRTFPVTSGKKWGAPYLWSLDMKPFLDEASTTASVAMSQAVVDYYNSWVTTEMGVTDLPNGLITGGTIPQLVAVTDTTSPLWNGNPDLPYVMDFGNNGIELDANGTAITPASFVGVAYTNQPQSSSAPKK